MTMLTLPPALELLRSYRQFIVCQLGPDPVHPGKTVKYPIDVNTRHVHNAHDKTIWMGADYALQCVDHWTQTEGPGKFCPGFVFTENDPFFFIDVDNCVDTSGQWTPIVHELSTALPGAAIEISQSGRGLHFFGTGSAPDDRRKKDKTNKLFDLYTEKRFVALTFNGMTGNIATNHTAALYALTDKHLKRDAAGDGTVGWDDGPFPGWNGPTDDEVLIRRALESQSAAAAFSNGNKASFADLWNCNVEVLARAYPPDGNGTTPYDASAVDRALAQHLAFWTGKDCARIEHIMRMSALRRDKWERADYLERTIAGAVAAQVAICVDRALEPVRGLADAAPAAGDELEIPSPTLVEGSTYVDTAQQVSMFKGCTYVIDAHRILVPGGLMLKPDQFRVVYGGYQFVVTPDGAKSTTDAWDAFTLSQTYRAPRADSTCYRPGLTAGVLVDFDGRKRVNAYWPSEVRRVQGDVTLFMRHLELLVPVARDREILLSYMCACVQHKGTKFKWAPFLQGVEGNGKTLLSQCVAYAVGRRHTHWPRADQIAEKFNSWLFDKVFIGVEDVYTSERDVDVLEILKPMITGENLAKRAMNTDQVDADCCANFMLNSNHKGGLRKTRNDRRIAPFFTAQQEKADLVRDGMGHAYFERLVGWLKRDGFAIVAELLATRPIDPEFNPATGQIAPLTSSTEEAIKHGFGKLEQEVMEAIEQGTHGFIGGWISSAAFDKLLANIGSVGKIAINTRRDVLKNLGYDWHPGLVNGRVNNTILSEGGKPRLFIKVGHPASYISGPVAIAAAYVEAQEPKSLQPLNNSPKM